MERCHSGKSGQMAGAAVGRKTLLSIASPFPFLRLSVNNEGERATVTIVDGMRCRERLGVLAFGLQWNPISIPSNLHSESVYRPTVRSSAMFASFVSRGVSKTSVRPAHNACHGAGPA